jgi:hypothetical protein
MPPECGLGDRAGCNSGTLPKLSCDAVRPDSHLRCSRSRRGRGRRRRGGRGWSCAWSLSSSMSSPRQRRVRDRVAAPPARAATRTAAACVIAWSPARGAHVRPAGALVAEPVRWTSRMVGEPSREPRACRRAPKHKERGHEDRRGPLPTPYGCYLRCARGLAAPRQDDAWDDAWQVANAKRGGGVRKASGASAGAPDRRQGGPSPDAETPDAESRPRSVPTSGAGASDVSARRIGRARHHGPRHTGGIAPAGRGVGWWRRPADRLARRNTGPARRF